MLPWVAFQARKRDDGSIAHKLPLEVVVCPYMANLPTKVCIGLHKLKYIVTKVRVSQLVRRICITFENLRTIQDSYLRQISVPV